MATPAVLKGIGDGGWLFRCPGCDSAHVIDSGWTCNGDVIRPTITPSILVNGRQGLIHPGMPRCHSFVTDGRIQFLEDCTHALAGQTVDLPPVDRERAR